MSEQVHIAVVVVLLFGGFLLIGVSLSIAQTTPPPARYIVPTIDPKGWTCEFDLSGEHHEGDVIRGTNCRKERP